MTKGKWLMVLAFVAFLVGAYVLLIPKPDEDMVSFALAPEMQGRPDCPYDTISQLALPGPITNVPEFHDCQRFIVKKGLFNNVMRFGALYAIWVREKLDSAVFPVPIAVGPGNIVNCPNQTLVRDTSGLCVPLDSASSSVLASVTVTATAVPVALIYSYGGRYHPLAIESGFNCLYLYHASGDTMAWKAKMVPVVLEKDCFANVDPNAVTGSELFVRRSAPEGYSGIDYPPVGRWDQDPITGRYYASLRCSAAWCEIGPRAFVSSAGYTPAPGSAQHTRVVAIKGWYDEQHLAFPSGSDLMPSDVMGTAFPDPMIDKLTLEDFDATQWIPVAYTVLSAGPTPYKEKLNYTEGSYPSAMNTVQFCHGTKERCIPEPIRSQLSCNVADQGEWWAMITAATQTEPAYRCVTYRAHPGITMPGTVRWRWLASDETNWVKCPNGCCQVQQ